MTKIERLKHRFASGMEEGRISSDEWKDEFLPMIEDAERYRWLRQGGSIKSQHPCPYKIQDSQLVVVGGVSLDDEIDTARNTTNEG